MNLRLTPTPLQGTVTVPASKSMSHRMVIGAALCESGESVIDNLSLSEDISATLKAVEALGASFGRLYKANLFKILGIVTDYVINVGRHHFCR